MPNSTTTAFRLNNPPPVDTSPLERLEKLEKDVQHILHELQLQKEFNSTVLKIINDARVLGPSAE